MTSSNVVEWAFDAVAGSSLVSRLSVAATADRLRILAYHGISDPGAFSRQIDYLSGRFVFVGPQEVVAALDGTAPLPERSVWVTFDDGDPTVVDHALPVLARYSVQSTMFICPQVVDTDDPYWWQIVETHDALGPSRLSDPDGLLATLRRMKSMPDSDRRSQVEEMAQRISSSGVEVKRRQVTTAELREYIGAGGSLGNHTWDHPCLDTCSPEEQANQIEEADLWLESAFPGQFRMFAYPNGNETAASQSTLERLGYRLAVTFDHRLADLSRQGRLELSRLRTNSELGSSRARAIFNGIHPLLHRARTTLVRWR